MLTDDERLLIDAICKGETDKAVHLLNLSTVNINCQDEAGMTVLSHACFKRNSELVQELIRRHVDVNANQHKEGYTCLMFAALRNENAEVVEMLLKAGARTDMLNSVGRTASQMAAFVGNHDIVPIINNFIHLDTILYYSKPMGVNNVIRLPRELCEPFQEFLINPNLSPISAMKFLSGKGRVLMSELKCAVNVLDELCRKYITAKETNEILSMKCHILKTIVLEFLAFVDSHKDEEKDLTHLFIKKLLAASPAGSHSGEERILRKALTDFPYGQSSLYQLLLKQLSSTSKNEEHVCFRLLSSQINGHNPFLSCHTESGDKPARLGICGCCHDIAARMTCSKCKTEFYCDRDCQKYHWFSHKKTCLLPSGVDSRPKNVAAEVSKVFA